jgi:saccharopepsin
LAEDVVNVNGIDVPAVTLLDATNIHPRTFVHWYTDYHGVLGLAPGFANPTPDIPSTWETIVDNGILERNVFSISPPTGLRYMDRPRTNGELIIGSLPLNSYEESAIKLPMKFGSYAWATSLESMTFGNFTTSFASGTAAFSTVYPFIFVPYEFGKEIIRQVEQGQEFGFFRSIPCEHRSTLPDWTFGIGGQTITLNAFQYTFEITASWMDESVCAFALERSESDTAVGLGWAFWQNFDAVAFDQDEQSIFLFP